MDDGSQNGDGCVLVRGGAYQGAQGGTFSTGISAGSAGSQALCLHRLHLPAGHRGRPHVHTGHESAVFMISGRSEVWHGPGFAERSVVAAGDFLYIPPDTPHLPVNTGEEDVHAVVARTDPREQEGVVLLELPDWLARQVGSLPVAEG